MFEANTNKLKQLESRLIKQAESPMLKLSPVAVEAVALSLELVQVVRDMNDALIIFNREAFEAIDEVRKNAG